MEPIPLIPKPKDKSNHDVSYVLKEVFQEELSEETIPTNIVANAQRKKQPNILINNAISNFQCVSFFLCF